MLTFEIFAYDPATLQVRTIDIDTPEYPGEKLQDVWALMDLNFSTFFHYRKNCKFAWGLCSIINVLMEQPWNLSLYLLILHYFFCLVKKKILETLTRKSDLSKCETNS